MDLRIDTPDGTVEFECEDSIASAWVSRGILSGETYPVLPFVDDVEVILDVGANCGAATVHFARHYPLARIHSFEPGHRQRAVLERNCTRLANVSVHPIGLHAHDGEADLFAGRGDSGMSSFTPGEWTTASSERAQLRSAGGWAAENGLDRIDIVKLDVEGCEVDVLRSLDALVATIKVAYVEYDSRTARREIDAVFDPTHHLYSGKVLLDQGEVVYLRADLADDPRADQYLRDTFTEAIADRIMPPDSES